MSSPKPSTSNGGDGASEEPKMTEEDLNRLVFDNASDYEDEEEVDENEPEKMDEVDNKVDDSWDDQEKMEDFAKKIQMKNKEREEESEAEKAQRDAKEVDEEDKIKAKKIKLVAEGPNTGRNEAMTEPNRSSGSEHQFGNVENTPR